MIIFPSHSWVSFRRFIFKNKCLSNGQLATLHCSIQLCHWARNVHCRKCSPELIPFLLTADLINTPPRRASRPFQCKCTPRRHPTALSLRRVPLTSESFFCGNFYSMRNQERTAGRSRILLGRWTMKMLRFTSPWAITSLKWSRGEHDERPMNVLNSLGMHGMPREIDDV